MSIVLHDCRIARRGKGAKGSIEIKTLGKPLIDEESGTAKDWDYTDIEAIPVSEMLEFCKDAGIHMSVGLAMAFDAYQKSENVRAKNARSGLVRHFMVALALEMEKAENLADGYNAMRENIRKANEFMPEDGKLVALTVEQFTANAKKSLDKAESEKKAKEAAAAK